jgi:hypothetical protein
VPRRIRDPKQPSERDWDRAAILEPRVLGRRGPELVGDGSGLAFPPGALAGAPRPLDPEDPAVLALQSHLTALATPKRAPLTPWKRAAALSAPPSIDGWRLLARTEEEALFGIGRPPQLLTIAFRQEGRRRRWNCVRSGAARTLRATRDDIRASSWRLDPTHEPEPADTMLRVLVTEQAFASGQRAQDRLLAPDLYMDENELVLTMFIAPRPGFQSGAGNPETPARIALAEPIGQRQLIDGALAEPALAEPSPRSEPGRRGVGEPGRRGVGEHELQGFDREP